MCIKNAISRNVQNKESVGLSAARDCGTVFPNHTHLLFEH